MFIPNIGSNFTCLYSEARNLRSPDSGQTGDHVPVACSSSRRPARKYLHMGISSASTPTSKTKGSCKPCAKPYFELPRCCCSFFLARGLRSFSLFLFRLAALLDFWDFWEATLKASEKPRLPEAFFKVLRFFPSFCNRRASPERRCCSNFFKLVVLAKAFRAAAASLGQVDV